MRRTYLIVATLGVLAACSNTSNPANGDNGEEPACVDDTVRCQLTQYQTCESGQWQTTETCTDECNAELGCVTCQPNANYCEGRDVYSCNGDGSAGTLSQTCTDGLTCSGGACVDACEEAAAARSYLGCEYFAVDADNAIEVMGQADEVNGCSGTGQPGAVQRDDINVCFNPDGVSTGIFGPTVYVAGLCEEGGECPSDFTCQTTPVCVLDAQNSPFAIVVSNPQEYEVGITLSDASGTEQSFDLAPGEVRSLFPQQLGFADHSINGSGVTASAYRVVSEAPIVAYQFNPLDNVDVFSNDGSLLIPRHAFDTRYFAMAWPSLNRRGGNDDPFNIFGSQNTNDYNGYVTVVAWEDGTEVRVTPSADVRKNTGFSAISAGQTQTFTLNAFEVLNIEAVADGDLTGTLVETAAADRTVGVFAGHEATVIQNTEDSCCADHIEEQMFPASTWGKDYVLARSESRGAGEPDVLRIMASAGGTTISFDPVPVDGTCGTLNVGDFCEVKIMVDTQISASNPVLVGHYLMSVIRQEGFDVIGSGDPALALAVPFEQYRNQYSFLVPSEYDEQYISVVSTTGATVMLDGVDVTSQFSPLGSGVFSAARIPVGDGQHTLACPSDRCGLEIYGYSDAVSYLFAGGLDLQQISIE